MADHVESPGRDELSAPDVAHIDKVVAVLRKELEQALDEYADGKIRTRGERVSTDGSWYALELPSAETLAQDESETTASAAFGQEAFDEEAVLLNLLNDQLVEANQAVQQTIQEVDLALKRIDAL